jgi:hypothetical protein
MGCRSAGYVKSDATAARSQTAAMDVRGEVSNLDSTVSLLNGLLENSTGNLTPQFTKFSQSLDQLEASSKRTAGRAPGFRKQAAAYFEGWDRQLPTVKDDAIRRASAARKTEAMGQFETAVRRFELAQDALKPVVDYLEDIRKTLSTDLTAAGLESVREPAKIAADNTAKIKETLNRSAADLDALSGKMSSVAPTVAKQ